jgi:hypothetical protein
VQVVTQSVSFGSDALLPGIIIAGAGALLLTAMLFITRK